MANTAGKLCVGQDGPQHNPRESEKCSDRSMRRIDNVPEVSEYFGFKTMKLQREKWLLRDVRPIHAQQQCSSVFDEHHDRRLK